MLVRRYSATENSISLSNKDGIRYADLNEVAANDKNGHAVNDTIRHFLQQRQAIKEV